MDIHDYLGVLRRGWALVVLGILVGLVGGFFAQQIEKPVYSATSRDLVTSESTGETDLNDSVQATGLAAGRVASYVLVASSGLVLEPVIDELNLDLTVEELAEQLTVASPPNTVVIEITATAATPTLARDIANAVSESFAKVIAEQLEPEPTPAPTPRPTLEPNGTPIPEPVVTLLRIVNIEKAELPTEPKMAIGGFFVVIGAVLGLGLGLVAASLREALDQRVRTRRDIAAVTDAPVIGTIKRDRALRLSPLAGGDRPNGSVSESFRSVRTGIGHVRIREQRSAFVITAINRSNGATMVAANLAVAIAKTATSVVVVDANIANPELTVMLGARGSLGLTDVLAGQVTLERALRVGPHGTRVLSVGTHPGATTELLATSAMRSLIATLREQFDVVLVDAPALSVGTEATVLGSFGCATILVVPAGAVTRPRLADTLATLAIGGQSPAGVILNRPPRRVAGRRAAAPAQRIVRDGGSFATASPERPARGGRSQRKAASTVAPPVLFQPAKVYPAPPAPFSPTPSESAPTVSSPSFAQHETTTGPITHTPFRVDGAAHATSPEPISELPRLGAAAPAATPRKLPTTTVIPVLPVRTDSPTTAVTPSGTIASVTAMSSVNAPATASNVTPLSSAVSRERKARESYLQRSRDLERAAAERLAHEQALLAQRVREQLDRERRQLSEELDNQLEETVLIPHTSTLAEK